MEKEQDTLFNLDLGSLGDSPFVDEATEETQVEQKEESSDKEDSTDETKEDINPFTVEQTDEESQDEDDTENEENSEEDSEETAKDASSEDLKDDKDSPSPLIPFVKFLREEGIFPNINVDEFSKSENPEEDFKELISSQINSELEELINQFPPELLKLANMTLKEGVPFKKLLDLQEEQFNFSQIKEESLADTDVQKQVLRQYLKETSKFSNEQIEEQINDWEDLDKLEKNAKTAYKNLGELVKSKEQSLIEEAKQEEKARAAKREEDLKNLRKLIDSTDEIIPGVKISKSRKDNLFKSISTPSGYDKNGNPVNDIIQARMQDPIGFEMKLRYLFDMTKGFNDFSTLQAGSKKSFINELENASKKLDSKASIKRTPTTNKTKKIFDWLE